MFALGSRVSVTAFTRCLLYTSTALLDSEQEKEAPFSRNTPKWRLFLKISDSLYVLSKQKNGKTIYRPTPLASRTYSGKFALRIPPEKHRELAIEAAEQHVSLNQLVVSRL